MNIELWIFAAAVFGLIIGSFLNVVIHRLPKMMENDWAVQCAELRNEELTRTAALQPGSATFSLPALRPPDHCMPKTFRS